MTTRSYYHASMLTLLLCVLNLGIAIAQHDWLMTGAAFAFTAVLYYMRLKDFPSQ